MRFLLALALLAYPGVVYLLAESSGPTVTACLFALVAGGRLLLAKNLSTGTVVGLIMALLALCVITIVIKSVVAVKFYPVAFSSALALWCAYTLRSPPTAIERLLNAVNQTAAGLPKPLLARIPQAAMGDAGLAPTKVQRRYMRGLTQSWAVFFVLNALITAYTAIATSTGVWALYTGIVSYVLIGLLVLLEMAYRPLYQRRYESEQSAELRSRETPDTRGADGHGRN